MNTPIQFRLANVELAVMIRSISWDDITVHEHDNCSVTDLMTCSGG